MPALSSGAAYVKGYTSAVVLSTDASIVDSGINVNDPLPTIEAEIKDMDPNYNYSGKFTIPESTILASVDNTTAEVYPFTYAAPDDNAGNPGQSVTINVIVQENGITILNSSIVDNTTQSLKGIIY